MILVFIDWFDPGFKAGGPIRSAVNFSKNLQHDYDVYVFTGDRDLGATSAYPDVKINEWTGYDERVKVFYCSPENLTWKTIRATLQELQPAVIYLNSMFSRFFTIYPLLIAGNGKSTARVVLAPRGMLRVSALKFKSLKKKVYLHAFKLLRLHKHIVFQATDDTELADVKSIFGDTSVVLLAPNLPGYIPSYPGSITKNAGSLKIVFTGRIHPIKNLDFLLTCLGKISGDVVLTVIGSEEDDVFATYCKGLATSLPDHIIVNFKGETPNDIVPLIIAEHHIFGLPTQGENFGHAIFEALILGKPVIISDQTPWRNLSAVHAGWDLPLGQPEQFISALQVMVDWSQEEYNNWSLSAWQYVKDTVGKKDLKTIYHQLFFGDVHTWN
jgi:glycosyltransferase involved in cell wall biosynthesis